jgi:Immunity protein 40
MQKFIEHLNTKGLRIDFGSRPDFALTRSNAIAALNILKEQGGGILGGDVFKLKNSQLVPAYANWCCIERVDETKQEFSLRSILAALDYIINYPVNEEEPYFVLVLD